MVEKGLMHWNGQLKHKASLQHGVGDWLDAGFANGWIQGAYQNLCKDGTKNHTPFSMNPPFVLSSAPTFDLTNGQ